MPYQIEFLTQIPKSEERPFKRLIIVCVPVVWKITKKLRTHLKFPKKANNQYSYAKTV